MRAATSGKSRLLGLLAITVLAVGISGCSRRHGGPRPVAAATTPVVAPTSRPAPPLSDGGVSLGAQAPCYTSLPASWRAALHGSALWVDQWDHLSSGAPTPEGSGVLVEQDTANSATFSIAGRDHRVTEVLGQVPRPNGQGQYSYDAADADHVAFVFNRSQGDDASYQWDLYLYDRQDHRLSAVAHNPTAGGKPLPGGWVQPVLTHDYLYWIQAGPDDKGWGGSQLMQYRFADGRTRVLYRGLTEAFTPYGSEILFTALAPGAANYSPSSATDPAGAPEVVQAVDQASGQPATPPVGLTAGPDGANTMVSDGDLVVWNTWDGAVHAWRAGWQKTITLIPSFSNWPEAAKLGLGAPAMPRLSGHFLVWNPSSDYVLDLRTDSFAQLTSQTSTEDVSGNWLSLESYADAHAYDQAQRRIRFDETLMNLSALPDLPGCGRT